MLKKLFFISLSLIILFLFAGCKEFYTFNLFDGLDYVPLPKIDKLQENPPEESVADLEQQMESDSFVETLINNPDALAEVQTYLEEVYSDPAVDADTRVEAAVLAADLELEASGGQLLLDNIFNAFTQIAELSGGTGATGGEDQAAVVQTILQQIVPAEVLTDEVAFTDMVAGLIAAGEIYVAMGEDMVTATGDLGFDDSGESVSGGVVFNAAITGVISEIISTLLLPAYQEPAVAAQVLWDIMNAQTPEELQAMVGATVDPSADFGSDFFDLPYLVNLAAAAGADLAALLGQAEPAVAP